ncbi:hypothetical protein P7C70_g3527, partial [Phenoliferia sp. Uapishka_3]
MPLIPAQTRRQPMTVDRRHPVTDQRLPLDTVPSHVQAVVDQYFKLLASDMSAFNFWRKVFWPLLMDFQDNENEALDIREFVPLTDGTFVPRVCWAWTNNRKGDIRLMLDGHHALFERAFESIKELQQQKDLLGPSQIVQMKELDNRLQILEDEVHAIECHLIFTICHEFGNAALRVWHPKYRTGRTPPGKQAQYDLNVGGGDASRGEVGEVVEAAFVGGISELVADRKRSNVLITRFSDGWRVWASKDTARVTDHFWSMTPLLTPLTSQKSTTPLSHHHSSLTFRPGSTPIGVATATRPSPSKVNSSQRRQPSNELWESTDTLERTEPLVFDVVDPVSLAGLSFGWDSDTDEKPVEEERVTMSLSPSVCSRFGVDVFDEDP